MTGWWAVFLLFTIPVGGGIPAGVLLAKQRGVGWPAMELLYFLSDVVLALVFEPIMLALIAGARRQPALARVKDVLKETVRRTTSNFGTAGGPLSLVLIAFGVDPMTGRAAARAAGHGFLTGWAIAITGDMMYFSVIMVSTLWLNSVLGDGTKTMVIVMLAMFVGPELVKRWRERAKPSA
ncbi:MAG: hypothetical protein HY079_00230 [Elusimicrobia bacterium]|nr:hypothetical protein [Elusimicrobiota bacterium]